jgi:hypothetical protein
VHTRRAARLQPKIDAMQACEGGELALIVSSERRQDAQERTSTGPRSPSADASSICGRRSRTDSRR